MWSQRKWIEIKLMSKIEMNEPNEKPRRYKWPWWVLAAFLLGVVLAIVWVSLEVRTVKRERDLNIPPSTNSTP